MHHNLNKTERLKIIAGQNNCLEIANFLDFLADDAANVNTPLPKEITNDSIDLRKFIHSYLKSVVADIKRMRNNRSNMSSVVSDDE